MGGIIDEARVALHAIWTRRWIALAVAWAVCIAGWLVVSQIPSRYDSKARVFVQMRSVLPAGADSMQAANDDARDIDTVRQTLTSAVSLEKVVRGTELAKTVSSDRDIADRVAGLQTAIKVTAQQDNLFEITTTAASPKLASSITQKLIDIFIETNLSTDRSQNTQTLAFLDNRLQALGTQLQDAEAKRAAFQNNYLGSLPGTGTISDRIGAARSQMSQVDADLAAAQSSMAALSGQMAATPKTIAGAGIAPGVGPARARLAAIQGQLADARDVVRRQVGAQLDHDVAAAVDAYRPATALYVGGMGAKEKNFHAELYKRMGYADAVDEIVSLFLSGKKAEAIAAVPDEMVRETMLVGTADEVRSQIKEWEAAGVTTMLVSPGSVAEIERLAAL